MIFAVIDIDYKSKLLFIEGTIDADRYVRNLVNFHFIEDFDEKHGVLNWMFQQDGAPSYVAEASIDWIEDDCDLRARWPADSPDLNPTELLWAILKNIVSQLKLSNFGELKQILLDARNSIPQSTIDRLCESFGTKLQFCLESDGESIGIHFWRCCGQWALLPWGCTHPLPIPWMPQEDNLIYRFVRTMIMKWTKIREALRDHTPLQVKKCWYSVLCRGELSLIDNLGEILDRRSQMHRNEFIEVIARA
jgi:hypothetical protein